MTRIKVYSVVFCMRNTAHRWPQRGQRSYEIRTHTHTHTSAHSPHIQHWELTWLVLRILAYFLSIFGWFLIVTQFHDPIEPLECVISNWSVNTHQIHFSFNDFQWMPSNPKHANQQLALYNLSKATQRKIDNPNEFWTHLVFHLSFSW